MFRGTPMIAHAITAALDSGLYQRVVVTTDSEEIAEVAEAYGAEVPYRRDASLADDHSGILPVIQDVALFYMASPNIWLESLRIYRDDAAIMEIPADRVCDIDPGKCPVAEDYYRRALSLPLYPGMEAKDIETVVRAVCSLS